jgi:hypothetical protein
LSPGCTIWFKAWSPSSYIIRQAGRISKYQPVSAIVPMGRTCRRLFPRIWQHGSIASDLGRILWLLPIRK